MMNQYEIMAEILRGGETCAPRRGVRIRQRSSRSFSE